MIMELKNADNRIVCIAVYCHNDAEVQQYVKKLLA